jgi:protein gp37
MSKQKEGGISWCDFTFNPWWGCEKVSAGCHNCYAEKWARRCGYDCFGLNKNIRAFGRAYWKKPILWDVKAKALGITYRVFCGSMCDIFQERLGVDIERTDLWRAIESTPNLIWLLLTKRPENILHFVPSRWLESWPGNAWTGTTIEQQKYEHRIIHLLRTPGKHFVSMEPLLGPLSLHLGIGSKGTVAQRTIEGFFPPVDWVIVGAESGPGARPMEIEWARSIVEQCKGAGVPVHVKQIHIDGKLSKNMDEWPEDLRVREFPEVSK